jgi:hypothetical protein
MDWRRRARSTAATTALKRKECRVCAIGSSRHRVHWLPACAASLGIGNVVAGDAFESLRPSAPVPLVPELAAFFGAAVSPQRWPPLFVNDRSSTKQGGSTGALLVREPARSTPSPHPDEMKADELFRNVPANIHEFRLALLGLPDNMKIKAGSETGVSEKTVGELRARTAWPPNLVITTPRKLSPSSIVKIRKVI